jgi:broad specificity phosphatase PhoE
MLILVRHGRTEANAGGLLQGRLDLPLDDLGRAQAAAAGKALVGATRVVCSPLLRTRQTAEAFGLPVTVDERWVELDYGEWDGRPLGSLPSEAWAHWRADVGFTPPGGESLVTLGKRVREACAELSDEAAENDVVVVSHVSPIKAAAAWALGTGDEISFRLFLSPAAITRVATAGPVPSLHSFNDTAHLLGIAP